MNQLEKWVSCGLQSDWHWWNHFLCSFINIIFVLFYFHLWNVIENEKQMKLE